MGAAAAPLYKRPASHHLDHEAKSSSGAPSVGCEGPHSGVLDGGGRVRFGTDRNF